MEDPEPDQDAIPKERDWTARGDGAIVRTPPHDAEWHATSLVVRQPLYARGDGISGPLRKVIAAREIGPTKTQLTKIDEPRFERRMHDMFGGGETPTPAAARTPPVTPKTQ